MLETGSDGDGERIGKLIREQLDRDGKENQSAVVAVLGGDGTAHGERERFIAELRSSDAPC